MTDTMTTRPDNTGTATMRSIALDRDLTFDFEFEPGASDVDIAHGAAAQLVVEEMRLIEGFEPELA